MAINLYTSRIVLKALGIEDYGVYNVVGGIVSLFSIVSGTLSASISRFITFELGAGDATRLNKIFGTSLYIQMCMAAIIIILCMTVGMWFLNDKMKIASDKMFAANLIFILSTLAFVINIMSVPYTAVIIAHEKMSAFAHVSIVDVTLKLLASFLLLLFKQDRLIYYALFILSISLLIRLIYVIYCNRHFSECKTRPIYEKDIFHSIGKFAGWNSIGAASSILRNQGNNIILNLFFGTVINAAYAIGMQVSNAMTQLADNFMTSVNPQITKYYAQKEYKEMNNLIYRSSRLSFYLTWLLSTLIIFDPSYILNLWLSNYPPQTVSFVQLLLVFVVIESISRPLITAQLATGNIKKYQIIVGGIQMLNLPISYLTLLKLDNPIVPFYIMIILSVCCLIARIIMLGQIMEFKPTHFIKNVCMRCTFVLICSIGFMALLSLSIHVNSLRTFILWDIICILTTSIIIYVLGCDKPERIFIKNRINIIISKIKLT